MDETDRAMLRLLQNGIPIESRPFLSVAEKLGCTEEEVIKRLQDLIAGGQVRRIGGVFDSQALGYYSALCALAVPEAEVDRVAEIINRIPGVTHNYLRDHPDLNLWFTLTCPSREQFEAHREHIEKTCGTRVHVYPARRKYKIRFYLPLEGENP